MLKIIISLALTLTYSAEVMSKALVSKETIATQKKLTKTFTLKNKIPVVYRQVPDSDILNIMVQFQMGYKDFPDGKKGAYELIYAVMNQGAKGYSREQIFKLMEKYSAGISCSGGIERSSCELSVLNEHFDKLMPTFTAIVTQPTFPTKELDLVRGQVLASLKQNRSDPGSFVNEVVNNVFYPKGHPYFQPMEQTLKEIEDTTQGDLSELHARHLSGDRTSIHVVGSLDETALKGALDGAFGKLGTVKVQLAQVSAPKFHKDRAFGFEHRAIPSAYIRIKMNAPGATHKDADAVKVMYKILDEELSEEIRTKRSLSYSIHAGVIGYSEGIGMIIASTSKPKETLEAIQEVIDGFKAKTYTEAQLEEFKTVYITNYFLTLEEHHSLNAALANSQFYFGNTDHLYELTKRLDEVSPADIKRVAQTYLKNLRVGVIYDKDKFKPEWAKKIIDKTSGS